MSRQNKKPNVIVFFTDQQRHDSTGVHGNPLGLTPNFDRMATEGMHAYHAFTCAPVCGPARACWQTGTHISTNGSYKNGIPLTDSLPHLADCFNQAGYHTGYIGKWHLAEGERGPVTKKQRGGYQSWLGANALEATSDVYDCVVYDEDNKQVKLPGYRVDALADAMIRHIDEHKDEPFFLFSSFLEPHHQNHVDDYPPPTGYRQRYTGEGGRGGSGCGGGGGGGGWTPPDLAALPAWDFEGEDENRHLIGGTAQQHLGGYWGMVKRLDEALGRVLDALKSLSLDQNTIVLFTSDHGCHFKTRNSEYKRSCHESSIRVPTAITGPGFFGGGRVQEMVSLVDLPATLLDAVGIAIPDTFEGHSLLEGKKNNFVNWPQEMYVQVCDSHMGRAIRTARWKYCVMASDPDDRSTSAKSYTEAYLYDLEHDPYELRNLVNMQSHEKVRQVMRQRLIRRMAEINEPAPNIIEAESKPSGQRVVSEQEAHS